MIREYQSTGTDKSLDTNEGAEKSVAPARTPQKPKAKRQQATALQRELSEARPLLSAIALGLIFALTLTLAASLAPDTVGAKAGRISQPSPSAPAPVAPSSQNNKTT